MTDVWFHAALWVGLALLATLLPIWLHDHVAAQLFRAATVEQAGMIVMGHRGKSLVERWLLGSVSTRVISYAPCSVLVGR